MDPLYNVNITDDYVTNVDDILEEVYKHPLSAFKDRSHGGGRYAFESIDGRGASMHTMMYPSFSPRLKELCVKSVDFGRFPPPMEVAINRYRPGTYIGKHKDGAARYWKIQLIFLKSSRSHFTWYDRDNKPHLVEEIPGRCVEIPLNVIHESTEIGLDEEDKYSMVFIWK